MCRERVFENYKVKVEFLNGDIEIVNHKNDSTSHTEVRKVYNETKESYKDVCCKVTMIGITKNGQEKIRYEKNIITDDIFIKTKIEEINRTTIEDVLEKLVELDEILSTKEDSVSRELSELDIRRDRLNHEIENFKETGDIMSVNKKAKKFNDLHIVLNRRRKVKNEQSCLNALKKKNVNLINTKEVKAILDFVRDKKLKGNDTKSQKMREVKFRSFKDRLRIVKELQKKYDKVRVDEERMVVTAYNVVYK